jgi:hypothetical protein
LTAAAAEHPRAVPRLLVPDRDAVAHLDTAGVHVQPAYEWLLERHADRSNNPS